MSNTKLISLGGCIISYSADISENELQLAFDYLFHKQCLNSGKVRCGRKDFTLSPENPEDPESKWLFESLNSACPVATEKEVDIYETVRIAGKALFIVKALRMRAVTCSVELKNAYI